MIECLFNISVQGDESSLMEYTRKWTLQVNRGGLFEIIDMTYQGFIQRGGGPGIFPPQLDFSPPKILKFSMM